MFWGKIVLVFDEFLKFNLKVSTLNNVFRVNWKRSLNIGDLTNFDFLGWHLRLTKCPMHEQALGRPKLFQNMVKISISLFNYISHYPEP